MEVIKDKQYTLICNFGSSRTGKTVTAAIYDNAGSAKGSGFTLGSVVELGGGFYGVTFTGTTLFNGYYKFTNTTDSLELWGTITVIEDIISDISNIRKIETNRWKVASNQLVVYDDDGTTPLYTFDLKDSAGNPDGDTPAERDPV